MTLEEAARNYSECLSRLDRAEHEAQAADEHKAEMDGNYHAAIFACERAKKDLLTAADSRGVVPDK